LKKKILHGQKAGKKEDLGLSKASDSGILLEQQIQPERFQKSNGSQDYAGFGWQAGLFGVFCKSINKDQKRIRGEKKQKRTKRAPRFHTHGEKQRRKNRGVACRRLFQTTVKASSKS